MEIVHIINHYWWFLNIYDVDYQNDQPKKEFCKTTFQYFSIFFELRLTTAVFSNHILLRSSGVAIYCERLYFHGNWWVGRMPLILRTEE